LVLLIFGGEVLRAFAFTLDFGILIGTYSSIFVASALVLEYANRKEKSSVLVNIYYVRLTLKVNLTFLKYMPPDITQLIKTLKREKADYIPIAELGIHPNIKEKFLGRPIFNLKDEIEFWYKAGYDYIKLQPAFNFDLISPENSMQDEKTDAVRKWAPESEGLIKTIDDLEKIHFPGERGDQLFFV
jgi:hypothetical protein